MIALRNELRKNIFRTTFRVVFFSVCLFWTAFSAFAQTTEPPIPKPTQPVGDYANVIDDATERRLNDRLKKLYDQQKIAIGVATVQSLGGRDIKQYSLEVARGWKIGSKEDDNPSLLFLVAIDDKRARTETSRDIEGDITDGTAGQVLREKFVPQATRGNYSQAINDTVEAYITILSQKRGFTLTDTNSPATRREPRSKSTGISGTKVCCVIIIIIIVIIILLIMNRGGGGRNRRSGGGGFGGIIPIPFPINTGGGGWGGDSGSSWGGGGGGSSGGGDWGGFGGGGDFGGGGADVSW